MSIALKTDKNIGETVFNKAIQVQIEHWKLITILKLISLLLVVISTPLAVYGERREEKLRKSILPGNWVPSKKHPNSLNCRKRFFFSP